MTAELLLPGSLTSVSDMREVLSVTVSSDDKFSHRSSHRIISDEETASWANGTLWPSRVDEEYVVLR